MMHEMRGVIKVLQSYLQGKLFRSISSLLRGYPLSYCISSLFPSISYKIGLFPRVIKAPDGSKYFCAIKDVLRVNLWDYDEYDSLESHIPRKGWIVIDVGAFCGLFSIKAARRVGLEGRVYAFEPNPMVFWWLKRNIELNRVKNIVAMPIALGSLMGYARLNIPSDNLGAASLLPSHLCRLGLRSSKNVSVKLWTLDEVFERIIKEDSADLIKIDVEGAEIDILRGASRVLRDRKIKRWIIEIHLTVNDPSSIRRYFPSIYKLKGYSYSPLGQKAIAYYQLE